jgi:hypothetical protein
MATADASRNFSGLANIFERCSENDIRVRERHQTRGRVKVRR